MAQSTKTSGAEKPSKPHHDFPLFPHATKRWAKKVRGKLHYFGPWSDPQGALERWIDQKDALLAGRKPRPKAEEDEATVRDVVNSFLSNKESLVERGELAKVTFDRYYRTCEEIISIFGRSRAAVDLSPADFQELRNIMAKRLGPVALGNEIQHVRSLFKFAYEMDILERPVKFGPGFKKPSAKVLRTTRAKKGNRTLSPDEIALLLAASTPNMRAMILLGLNAGLGNTDVALLKAENLDLNTCWIDYPRPKTGTVRRAPLWPETVSSLAAVSKDQSGDRLFFIGPRGVDYVGGRKGYRVNQEFVRVATVAKVTGHSFYDLRRTFQTIGEGCHDLSAVQAIMGHAPGRADMSAIYRQGVEDDRLQRVVDHVREWLFGGAV